MIIINGKKIGAEEVLIHYKENSIEFQILDILLKSNFIYKYSAIEELLFEVNVRKSIVDSAIELNRTKFSFKIFRESKCNPDYWTRTPNGGFKLNRGVTPYDAIKDIYKNSSKYGTECATAIVIIFYKALINIYPEDLYNRVFQDIFLMNWLHIDGDLGVKYHSSPPDYLPGDCRYFDNPDVNPLNPELQGENVIDLGEGKYYGHGIGIKKADQIIQFLNKYRIDNPTQTAFLVDSATRPNFKHLYRLYKNYLIEIESEYNIQSA